MQLSIAYRFVAVRGGIDLLNDRRFTRSNNLTIAGSKVMCCTFAQSKPCNA